MQERFRDFTLLISNVSRAINKIKNHEMKKYGLKGTQVSCLFYLYGKKQEMTATDICALCEEDKGAISRALKELENKGLITYKNDDNKKKYNSIILLTPSGYDTAEKITNTIAEIIKYDKTYITEKELIQFYGTFNKIYENLKTISDNYGGKND